jgi:hypothetical protein
MWLSWQGESGIQAFDLDCVGSIPAIPQHSLPALLMSTINLLDDVVLQCDVELDPIHELAVISKFLGSNG